VEMARWRAVARSYAWVSMVGRESVCGRAESGAEKRMVNWVSAVGGPEPVGAEGDREIDEDACGRAPDRDGW